jgi:hypothetical protein
VVCKPGPAVLLFQIRLQIRRTTKSYRASLDRPQTHDPHAHRGVLMAFVPSGSAHDSRLRGSHLTKLGR